MAKYGKILIDKVGMEAAHGLYKQVVSGSLGYSA
jgi:hypothetical protein